MGLIDYKYTTQIDPSPELATVKIKDIRQKIVQHLKSNGFLYGAVDYNPKTISFDNATIVRRIFPFFSLKSYEIKFRQRQGSVEIEGAVFPGGLIIMTLILIGAFLFNLFLGLTLFPVFGLFFAFNYLSGTREIKDIINIGLKSDLPKKLEVSKEQREWIEDDSKCPACGHGLQRNLEDCPDCGLRLRLK